MAAHPILLALVWHMHQPSYRDTATGRSLLPWTRLHATKDYRDMVELLGAYPRVRCTFNLTPVLLDQLERIAAGEEDEALRLARAVPDKLAAEERQTLLRDFFSVHRERMLEPRPRYRALWARAEEERAGGAPLDETELRDLQVWFHLAWVDPSYAGEEPIRSLLAKGEGYTEAEKQQLLDWGVALAGTVIPAYRKAEAAGQIEIATSAHYHPILPLLVDSGAPRESGASLPLPDPPFRALEDARAQLRSARTSHGRRFGTLPHGTWPPEGAVSDAALGAIRAQGFAWAASDESVLHRALSLNGQAGPDWPVARCRPYRVETPAGSLAMLFRDRALSDRIGFVYQRWDPVDAAEDFLEQVRASAASAHDEGPALVTVILDGENCWEGYEEDGRPFLTALYERLDADPVIEAVTVSSALERIPPATVLRHVPVGSWIRDDLAIWIGHAEKNAAWAALREARALLAARGDAAPQEIWESLYAAEGSDWFWWYGDDHQSDHKEIFDTIFRSHLLRIYTALGTEPPEALRASLRRTVAERTRDGADTAWSDVDGAAATSWSGADGAPGPSWSGAASYDPIAAGGSMHRVARLLERLWHRTHDGVLWLRLRLASGAGLQGAAVVIRFEGSGAAARIPLDGPPSGVPAWQGAAPEDPGDYARAVDPADLVIRVPFRTASSGPDGVSPWRLEIERGGAVEERAPLEGAFGGSGISGTDEPRRA